MPGSPEGTRYTRPAAPMVPHSRSRLLRSLVPVALAAALAPGAAAQDLVVLEGGKELEGRVVYRDAERLVLRSGSRDREIDAEDVVEVRTVEDGLRRLLDLERRSPATNGVRQAELARIAASEGLPEMAALFWWRTLLAEPGNGEAHEALGHRRKGDGWVVPHTSGRAWDLENRAELARDWNDAWELESEHYALRGNLPLDQLVSAAIDLERFYLWFYDTYAERFGLYAAPETMGVHVHGDQTSFPEALGARRAYFSPSDNVLRVNATGGFDPESLIHEATHQVLFTVAERETTNSGDVPAWLDEGLAMVVAAGVTGEPGRLGFDGDPLRPAVFRAQAEADDPLSLARCLNLRGTDFSSGTTVQLAYVQSYTLVHYLLRGEDGALSDGLDAFVRSALQGKSSSSHLEKALGVKKRDLEEGWIEYVERLAGE